MSTELEGNRVRAITLPGLTPDTATAANSHADWSLLNDIEVVLCVRLGSAHLRLWDLLGLASGDVLTLDTALDGDVTVLMDGHLVALGALIAHERCFGVRITATAAN